MFSSRPRASGPLCHREGRPVGGPNQHRTGGPHTSSLLWRTIMFLIPHRDDFRPTGCRARTHRIGLQKLAPHECEQMVAAVAGSEIVPRRITSQIVERTDGVPLFVEEFMRTVVDSGAVPLAAESPASSTKLPDLVPASIHDSLMERLDRLASPSASPRSPLFSEGASIMRAFPACFQVKASLGTRVAGA